MENTDHVVFNCKPTYKYQWSPEFLQIHHRLLWREKIMSIHKKISKQNFPSLHLEPFVWHSQMSVSKMQKEDNASCIFTKTLWAETSKATLRVSIATLSDGSCCHMYLSKQSLTQPHTERKVLDWSHKQWICVIRLVPVFPTLLSTWSCRRSSCLPRSWEWEH